MRVILDSNILLVALPKKSKYRILFDAFLDNKLSLVISNEILTEYQEVIARFTNEIVANNVCELLLKRNNVEKHEIFFR